MSILVRYVIPALLAAAALAPQSASAQQVYIGVGRQPVYQQQPVYQTQPVYQQQYGGCQYHRQCSGDQRCMNGVCTAPTGYENTPNWGLIVPGIIVLGAGYVTNVIVSAFVVSAANSFGSVGYEPFYAGFVPIAGPWIELGFYSYDDGLASYLIVDGIAQAVGLTLIIIGAVVGHTTPYWALGGEGGPQLAILPTFGPDGGGLNASLRF